MKFSFTTAAYFCCMALSLQTVKSNITIEVDHTQTFQTFHGCGASWTDTSAWIMNGNRNNPASDPRSLSQQEKGEIFASLFSKSCDGCIGLDIIRQPMGTSDFRWGDYTYEDTRGSFSIGRDKAYIIPTIQRSIQENLDLKVMALPWSAPAWAKSNNNLNGGSWTYDQNARNDYYQYYVDFVNAYEAEGIPIWALSVQNEPQHASNDYPTMMMSSYDHGVLIEGVRSALDAANRDDIRVVGYDHNWDTPWYVSNFLNNAGPRNAVSAIGFHCYGGNPSAQTTIKNQFPEVEIFFTECTEHGTVNSFNGDFRWALRNLVIDSTRNWASTVIEWNLVLYYNGPKAYGGCSDCRGLIDVDNSGYTKNPAFYALGHLSKFVQSGAKRIASTENPNSNLKTVAMLNPDGSSFVVILNDGWPDRTFDLEWLGATCSVFVKSWSAVTVFRASGSYTMEVWRTTDQEANTRLSHTENINCVPDPNATPLPTPQPTPAPVMPDPTNKPSSQPSARPSPVPSPAPSSKPSAVASKFPSSTPTMSQTCSALIQQLQDECGISV